MVCPKCKHELNPLARVCPTCGMPIPATLTEAAIVITPETLAAAEIRKKRGATTARVFTVVFCVLAAVLSVVAAWLWFVPSLTVYAAEPVAASVSFSSMFELTYGAVPWLTYAALALCVVCAVSCLVALGKKSAGKRRRLLIPKLAVLGAAACYAAAFAWPDLVPGIWDAITGWEAHINFFTIALAALLVLLFIASELTISNRRKLQEWELEDLKEYIIALGIPLEAETAAEEE